MVEQVEDTTKVEEDETFLAHKYINLNEDYLAEESWDKLKINTELRDLLIQKGFTKPSRIQSSVISRIKEKPEIILRAQSQNGSGKTLSFLVSMLETIDETKSTAPTIKSGPTGVSATFSPQAVILSNTRELANQILKVLNNIITYPDGKVYKNLRPCLIKAGDYSSLLEGGHVLITTPGTILNLLKGSATVKTVDPHTNKQNNVKVNLSLKELKLLIIDEVDDIFSGSQTGAQSTESILKVTNPKSKILFISATFNNELKEFMDRFFENKEVSKIEIPQEKLNLTNIRQLYFETDAGQKTDFLIKLLKNIEFEGQIIIFVNRTDEANQMHKALNDEDFKSYVLHAGLTNEERDKAIKFFLKGDLKVLITTNLLSRGIDNKSVGFVINADVPLKYDPVTRQRSIDYECYLHRVGRTGRFGHKGIALNLVDSPNDTKQLKDIEGYYKSNIEKLEKMSTLIGYFSEMLETNKGIDKYLETNK
eukprot:CAMPEP_0176424136 /NCGR_PEP_ID=MMETSP0127-20121128/10673_1 /TAXON_ID=938130 /ORGANISM="Platyophrya macrostoma, Strain WH" /LENGTH=479 /DNA_ID=CAMNT_0017805167 /DNA_START=28 /DNA_END=1467 /DNA_ORIENTATION=-